MLASKYRVVEVPILQSPCRKCTENICSRSNCSKLVEFNKRCDEEVTGYGVCDFSDELPAPVKFNYSKEMAYEEEDLAPAAKAAEPAPTPVVEPEPTLTVEPAPATTLFPADMTLEQFFPPARMAQFGKPIQLSLF